MTFLTKLEILAGKVLPFDPKKSSLSLKKVQKKLQTLRSKKKPHLRTVTPEENLAHELQAGDRVRVVQMDNDPYPIAPGTEGTIENVNWYTPDKSKGQISVKWDNGRRLKVLVPEDKIQKI